MPEPLKVLYVIDAGSAGTPYWVAAAHVHALRRVGVDADLLVVGEAARLTDKGDAVVRRAPALGQDLIASVDAVVAVDPSSLRSTLAYAPPVCARLVVAAATGPSSPMRRSRVAGSRAGQAEDANPASAAQVLTLAASPSLVELLQRRGAVTSGDRLCTWARTAAVIPPTKVPRFDGLRVLLAAGIESADDAWAREALAPLRSETPSLELVGLHPDGEASSARQPSLAALVDLLADADIVVSTWEDVAGLDFVSLQALAAGAAVVLTDGPSSRDLDPRGRATMTVGAGDRAALLQAVRRLRDDHALRARLGQEGRRLAVSPSLEESGTLLEEILTAARDRRAILDDWRRAPWPVSLSSRPESAAGNGEACRRYQWEVECELARRLLPTTRSQRRQLYSLAYDELFRRVPFQPQLDQARDPIARRTLVDLQRQLVEPFVETSTVLLEIGAGDCAFASAMAGRVRQVHAIEASRMENEPTAPAPPNFHFALADLPPVPVANGSIDVAYSSHVIEHLHPDDLLPHLRDVLRTLVPGGLYLCVTPNRLLGPHDVSRYFARRASGLHLREYTHCELARALRRSGFSPVRVVRRLGEGPARGRLAIVSVVEAILELVPAAPRRHLLTRLSRRQEPFRPLEQVKLVAWRPLELG